MVALVTSPAPAKAGAVKPSANANANMETSVFMTFHSLRLLLGGIGERQLGALVPPATEDFLIQSPRLRLLFGNARAPSKPRGLLGKERPILWRVALVGRLLLVNLGEWVVLVGRQLRLAKRGSSRRTRLGPLLSPLDLRPLTVGPRLNVPFNEVCDPTQGKNIKKPDQKTYTDEQCLGGLVHISAP